MLLRRKDHFGAKCLLNPRTKSELPALAGIRSLQYANNCTFPQNAAIQGEQAIHQHCGRYLMQVLCQRPESAFSPSQVLNRRVHVRATPHITRVVPNSRTMRDLMDIMSDEGFTAERTKAEHRHNLLSQDLNQGFTTFQFEVSLVGLSRIPVLLQMISACLNHK